MIENEVLSDFVKMSKMLEEKDCHIKELEEEHDFAIDKFEEAKEELRKQIRTETDARKRVVEKFKLYKKAFELAFFRVQYLTNIIIEKKSVLIDDKVDKDWFLRNAKEQINESNNNKY